MTVLIDTGPLAAYFNKGDPMHRRANALLERIWSGELGHPLSTDFVLDEGLTLLRRRPGRKALSKAFSDLFLGPMAEGKHALRMLATTDEVLLAARDLQLAQYERGLSFTDCTLVVHAQRLDAVLATFDKELEGMVPIASG